MVLSALSVLKRRQEREVISNVVSKIQWHCHQKGESEVMPHTVLSLSRLCMQKAVLTSSILGRSHHLALLRAKADITGMTLLTR